MSNCFNFGQKAHGFSLLELIFTLMLLGLLLTLSMPSLGAGTRSRQLKFELHRLKTFLEQSVLRAGAHESVLVINAAADSYRLLDDSDPPRLIQEIDLPESIRMEKPTKITLHAGRVNSAASLTLLSSDMRCSVVISLRGRVREACSRLK